MRIAVGLFDLDSDTPCVIGQDYPDTPKNKRRLMTVIKEYYRLAETRTELSLVAAMIPVHVTVAKSLRQRQEG